ncbi:MAG: nucleotidyltransferase domain-containing protein [Oscillospiraceae bacterium]|nr:nucleotidyltransferase domain-containing protein [Oscillospiraceae bacterium]
MYDSNQINEFVSLVAEATNPDRIILFGSYAYGNPSDNSDLDLLVIKNGKELTRDDEADLEVAVYDMRKRRHLKTRYDVFFRTDEQVEKSLEDGGAFVDAIKRGRLVYERAHQ